ncbi:MAG: radical SAM protein, partial [Candidatus Caldarchaeum sp.]|nr:radical SAM protein [Candidatus Caldarchaeum sp.]
MASFTSLETWSSPELKGRLEWYYSVANNLKPAKYLICRHIPVGQDIRQLSEDELWGIHEKKAEEFSRVFKEIRDGGLKLKELSVERPNFLDLKVALVKKMLTHCNFCRWNCRVDRSAAKKFGTCQLAEVSRVSSYFHHRGEELPIRGTKGSGTIFFTSCNMRCVFCQNADISHDKDNGIVFTPHMLAWTMWQLRMEGCHNINLVGGEPTIHLHTIVEAISLLRFFKNVEEAALEAKADLYIPYPLDVRNASFEGEFNTPILWNSNMYMSPETMKILHELVDIWLPDFKFGNNRCAVALSRTPWYFETVAENHKLIYSWNEDIVIRHLIMPGHVECCTKPVLKWIADNMPLTPVNVMDQYHPDCYCNPS